MSGGQPEVVQGIGLLPGSLTVHRDGEAERFPVYEEAVATGLLPAGFAADDCAAVLFNGTTMAGCVASRTGARVMRIQPDGNGGVLEIEQDVRLLPHAAGTHVALEQAKEDSWGVSEMRALRAGRHRWD